MTSSVHDVSLKGNISDVLHAFSVCALSWLGVTVSWLGDNAFLGEISYVISKRNTQIFLKIKTFFNLVDSIKIESNLKKIAF